LQEIKDPAGVNFRLKDPPFLIGEAQYKYNQEMESEGLAGTIKIGGWYHFGQFNDYDFGIDGRSLADPLSNGQPLVHLGDFGVYGGIDQMLWRLPGERSKKRHWRIRAYCGKPFGSQSDELLCGGRNQFHGDLEATAGRHIWMRCGLFTILPVDKRL
jgi:hypothetical protein